MTTQVIKEGGKTIIKTGERIDSSNADVFENDIVLDTTYTTGARFVMTLPK